MKKPKHVVRRELKLMMKVVYRGHDKSYMKYATYIEMVRATNPSSHAYISWFF